MRCYSNYYVHEGMRCYYGGVPDMIQLEDHAFIDATLCEHFTLYMGIAWWVTTSVWLRYLTYNNIFIGFLLIIAQTFTTLRTTTIVYRARVFHIHSLWARNKCFALSLSMLFWGNGLNGRWPWSCQMVVIKTQGWRKQLRWGITWLSKRGRKKRCMHVKYANGSYRATGSTDWVSTFLSNLYLDFYVHSV